MSTNKHDSDFFDAALRQIHHDARQGATIPEQTPFRQLTDAVCAITDTVTAPIRKYMQDVNNAPYAHDAQKASPTQKPTPLTDAADFLPVRAMTTTGEAASSEASVPASTPKTKKTSRWMKLLHKSTSKTTRTTQPAPPEQLNNARQISDASSTPKPTNPTSVKRPRRATRSKAKKHRTSPWIAVLVITIVMLGAGTGLWLMFGYRTAESTATRYAQALYSGDADALYGLYTQPRLAALARTKRFTSIDEFLTSEKNRFARSRENWEKDLGPNYSIDVKLTDLSKKYQIILSSYAAGYEVSYNLELEPEDIRWYTVDITLRGNQQVLSKTKPLILVRVGTWWYVFDTPAA